MNPVQASFDRSAKRFAERFGITEEDQMAIATPTRAPGNGTRTKTAAGPNAENDMKGSQLQTGLDRGDYSGQTEEVNKQKTETQQQGKEGTEQAGNQDQSVKYDDKNYGLSGSGGAARVAVVRTVAKLADIDPNAAIRFLRFAEGVGDIGTPMGGEPDAVKEGDEAAEGGDPAGGAAPAPAAPAGPSADQAAQVKLTDIIRDAEQQIEIDKAVNDKLKEVAKEVGAKIKLPYLGVGTITAWHRDGFAAKFASVDATVRFKTTAAPMPMAAPAPSVPSAPTSVQTKDPKKSTPTARPAVDPQVDVNSETKDLPQTDKTLNSIQGRKVRHPSLGEGKVTAIRGSKVAVSFPNDIVVMMPKSALARKDEGGKTPQDEMGNKKVPHTAVDVQDKPQNDGDPDWTLYDQSRESQKTNETDSHNMQQFSDSADRDYRLASKKLALAQAALRQQVKSLVANGMEVRDATRKVAQTKLGQAVMAAVKKQKIIEAARKQSSESDPVAFGKAYDRGYQWAENLGRNNISEEEAVAAAGDDSTGGFMEAVMDWLEEQDQHFAKSSRHKLAARKQAAFEAEGFDVESDDFTGDIFSLKASTMSEAVKEFLTELKSMGVVGAKVANQTDKAATVLSGDGEQGWAIRVKGGEGQNKQSRRKQAADDATGRQVGGNTPPDEMKSDQADDTTRYDGKEKGDTGDDVVSAGTDTTLESPETSTTINDARGTLDKRHRDETAGSTVAMFSPDERPKILAQLKQVDQAYDALGVAAKNVAPFVVTHQGKGAVLAAVKELATDLKHQGDVIEAALKATVGDRHKLRSKLADAITASRLLMKAARREVDMLGVMAKEANHHRVRFARVSPAFKLAAMQLQSGLIGGDELAPKVAEYINLDKTSFEVLSRNVSETITKMARRPLQQRTAKRLPFVGTDGPVSSSQQRDELDGVFDD